MISSDTTHELAHLTLAIWRGAIPPVARFVRFLAVTQGLSDEKATHLEVAVEEACLNIVENAFEGESEGTFVVQVALESESLLVTILDAGVPFHFRMLDSGEGFGGKLLRGLVDEVKVLSEGNHGSRIEIRKRLR